MAGKAVPVHNLRPNDTVWTPGHVAFFDTETRASELEDGRTLQQLRCWSARRVDRRPAENRAQVDECSQGLSAAQLADQVERWMVARSNLWIFAHNLAFDLATTRLPLLLGEKGWEVTDLAADSAAPWMRLHRRGKRITLTDSWSWLPRPLAQIGAAVGIGKPALPEDTDSPEAWAARCAADVDITATAILQLMDWWDRERKGRWTVTGSASGWNAFRHTPPVQRVTIDPDPVRIAEDRQALHGGIRYVWRHGTLPEGLYTEVDITRAYLTVARTQRLPMKRMRDFDTYDPDGPLFAGRNFAAIARVLVEVEEPTYPVKVDKLTWLPVGRFWTTLAGPELAAAREAGHIRAVGHTVIHRLGDTMSTWARWCDALASGQYEGAPPVAQIAGKHWSRAVIGKWSQRKYGRTLLGPAPTNGWGYQQAWIAATGTRGAILDIGGQRWISETVGDADNAYPAVLAFVESHVRAAVIRIAAALPAGKLVQADTDGIMVADLTDADLEAARTAAGFFDVRPKRSYGRLQVLGPQHLIRDGHPKLAGIPSSATFTSPTEVAVTYWPSLATQMGRGSNLGYVQTHHTVRIRPNHVPGWVTADGTVLAVELCTDADGVNRIVPWRATRWAQQGEQLAPDQHRLLAPYVPQGGAQHP